jgi:hypothetical protein
MVVEAAETVALVPAVVVGGEPAVRNGVCYGAPWDEKMCASDGGENGASSEGGGGQNKDLLSND